MTPAERRAKCIEVSAKAYYESKRHINVTYPTPAWDELGPISRGYKMRRIAAAFDALHGIACVVPIEATEEMIYIGELVKADGGHVEDVFASMAKVGNLALGEKA